MWRDGVSECVRVRERTFKNTQTERNSVRDRDYEVESQRECDRARDSDAHHSIPPTSHHM